MSSGIDTDKPNQGAALTVDVRTNFIATKTELDDLHRISEDSKTASGTNILTVTYSPEATGPTSGQLFGFKAAATNTGAVTFNPNSLGALAVQVEGSGLVAGQIQINGQYIIKYDGSVYQLLNPSPNVVNGGLKITGLINLPRTSLTIAGGEITVTGSYHRVDTEGGGSTDDLVTINGGGLGDVLILTSVNTSRDPTLKDGTGNLRLAGDFTFVGSTDSIMLIFEDTVWIELSRSIN